MLSTIDLFAGAGGIRAGFESQGFQTVFANDIEPRCKQTYDLNFASTGLTVADLRDVDLTKLPKADFVLAGFPCQPFSIAGKREGFEDDRNGDLFFTVADLINKVKPQGFLLENVRNLVTHNQGKTFGIIKYTLEQELGYSIQAEVLNSATHGGLPQNRERVFIVGFRNPEHSIGFSFPNSIPLNTSVKDLLETNVASKYYYEGTPLFEKLKDHVTDRSVVYQWRRRYVRANKSGLCPTLTANMGTGGHNVPIILDSRGIRKLTPLECFKLQGFTDIKLPDISNGSLYKQAGNSVSVPLIARIAKQIKQAVA